MESRAEDDKGSHFGMCEKSIQVKGVGVSKNKTKQLPWIRYMPGMIKKTSSQFMWNYSK